MLEPRALLSAITVTTLADNLTTGDGEITLREALAAANTNASVDGSVAGDSGVQDEINFAPGLIGTIPLDSGLEQLQITDSVRIVGLGAKDTIVDAQLNSRVFDITSTAGDVALDGVTITGGKTIGDAERGAGIRFLSTGTLTLTGSSVSGNSTDGFTSFGAGIYTNVGAVVVVNSLISGNTTLGRGSDGAGLFSQNGQISLINSTVSGNTTSGYHSDGAAIYTVGGLASVSLTNSTVTKNDAIGTEDGGSGGVAVVRAAVTIKNSILTGNFNRDGSERDLWISGYANPQTFSASHSIFGATSEVPIDPAPIGSADANGNLVGTIADPIDAKLAPLADNGGPTMTHALYANSPAIDAGHNALALDFSSVLLATDQRGTGFPRIDNGTVDMGSYEGEVGNYPVPPLNFPLVVTVADDEFDSDLSDPDDLSLREAIELANQTPGSDTITFSTGMPGATIELSLGQLTITDSLTIAGLGASNTIIDADGEGRVFDVTSTAGAVTFDGVTIRGGLTEGDGEEGAGIRSLSPGRLTISRSVVADNQTLRASPGGGIYTRTGPVTILSSTVSGNSVTADHYDGGGVYSLDGDVEVINSTISSNTVFGAYGDGAGIYSMNGDVTITNSTITLNSTRGMRSDGGGIKTVRGSLSLANSIVSGNSVWVGYSETSDICFINYVSSAQFTASHSLIAVNASTGLDPTTGGIPDADGNLVGTYATPLDPGLAPLADNGGATPTHALLPDSPAINGGDNNLAVDSAGNPLVTDQRGPGFSRISNTFVDMGSYEAVLPSIQLIVTTADDELDVDVSDPGDLSLREALALANAHPGLDTITFDPSLSDIPIQLGLGQLLITDSVQIAGLGANHTVIDARQASRVFDLLASAGDVEFDGVTITGGKTTGYAEVGGGIRKTGIGTLTLTASVVSANSTTGDRSLGGGVYASAGAIVAVDSLISGNSTSGLGADGGAIFSQNAAITLTNSTLTGSRTSGYHSGGAGIYTLGGGGSVTLTNSTVTDNNGVGVGQGTEGGIAVIRAAVRIVNSMVTGNFKDDGTQFDIGISGYADPATFYASHSIIGVNTGNPLNPTPVGSPDANGNLVGTQAHPIDPKLGPLSDIGGPTKTFFLYQGSPAIDAGDNSLALAPDGSPLTTDQRGTGYPRIDHLIVDIGSFEGHYPDYPPKVSQHTFVVTTANDELDSDLSDPGDLSLREAIELANNSFGLDTITFASGLSGATFDLTLGQLTILDDLKIVGLGARNTVIDAQQQSRVLNVPQSLVDLTLEEITVTGGQTTGLAEVGGGIRIGRAGTLTLTRSVVSGNSTTGINSYGGGIYAYGGAVTAVDSLISGNSTTGRGGDGGAIFSWNSVLNLTNSTLSGNRTSGYHAGGAAIYTFHGESSITLTNSTVTDNSGIGSESEAGGGIVALRGRVSIRNSIITGNFNNDGTEFDFGISGYANPASVTTTHSIIGVNTGNPFNPAPVGSPDANGNFIGTQVGPINARLAPLADNGGLTPTHALLDDSPAINAGDNTLAVDPDGSPLPYEQRGPGFDRIIGGTVDMGAFESDAVPETPAFPREETIEGYYFDGNGLAKVLSNGNNLTIIDSHGNVSSATLPGQSRRIAALSISSTPTPVSFDPITGTLTFSNGAVWNKVVNLAGRWLNANAQETGVRQFGADLSFTNVLGQSSSGRFLSATQVVATDWGNIIGTLTNGGQRIEWSNGKVWDLIPDLEANWSNQSQKPTRVEQLGSQLVFVNRLGQTSAGYLLDATHVVATGWGNVLGTLSNGQIEWANGTVWTQLPGAGVETDLAGLWDVAGKDTRVLQADQTLTFVNRLGEISGGHFLTSTTVIATDWNVQGTITGDFLRWSNGTVWTRLPELGGAWIDVTGKEAGINQLERSLTFTDPQGRVTHGTLVSPNRVTESGSRRIGRLVGDFVTWSDGRVWSQIADLRGSWTTVPGGAPTFVTQSGVSLLMISDTGVVGRGKFIGGKVASVVFSGAPTVAVEIEVPGKSSLAFANGWLWQRPTTSSLDDVFSDPNLWPFA